MSPRGYRTISLPTSQGEIVPVRTSARVADALQHIVDTTSLYDGVRLTQVMEAVYRQGLKDGARNTIEAVDKSLIPVRRQIPKKPGRPRKR